MNNNKTQIEINGFVEMEEKLTLFSSVFLFINLPKRKLNGKMWNVRHIILDGYYYIIAADGILSEILKTEIWIDIRFYDW